MVRLTVHQLMARRGITAYALSRGARLSYPSAYRLSRPGGGFGRLHADTLDRLCAFFRGATRPAAGVGPGQATQAARAFVSPDMRVPSG